MSAYLALLDTNFESNNKREWALFRVGFVYYKQKLGKSGGGLRQSEILGIRLGGSASRMFLADAYLQMGKKSGKGCFIWTASGISPSAIMRTVHAPNYFITT